MASAQPRLLKLFFMIANLTLYTKIKILNLGAIISIFSKSIFVLATLFLLQVTTRHCGHEILMARLKEKSVKANGCFL